MCTPSTPPATPCSLASPRVMILVIILAFVAVVAGFGNAPAVVPGLAPRPRRSPRTPRWPRAVLGA